jgi:CRISPR-associated protein Csd1
LKALLQFCTRPEATPSFLRWGVSHESKASEKPAWWLTTASGNELKLGPENFTFEVNGQLLLHDEQILRPYWRRIFQQEVAASDTRATPGLCLITGLDNVPIADTHPKIKGVPNTQAFGAAIVSFDKPAFASYGFEQSHNAPASIEAATAYTVALNWLISRRNHSLRIGQTAVCFWARDKEEASDFFAAMLDRPDPRSVREFLSAPWAGVDRGLLQHDEFYSVTLSGNAGRIVVRHWMQTTVEAARENLHHWFADLEIAGYGDPAAKEKRKTKEKTGNGSTKEAPQPLALYSLAVTTVRDAKDLQSEVLTGLYRAALEGTAPSLLLLKPILHRFENELVRDGPKALYRISRFALLRLILNRNRKVGEPMIEPQAYDTDDAAYNCGRLLAIFDDLQMKAHEYQLEGAGVVERYYGSAASAPNSAFGILWRLHQHHLKKVSRQGDRGKAAAEAIKRRIAEIACRFPQPKPNLPPSFPRTFDLQAQGRFALGFYQQKAADDAARRTHRVASEDSE